MARPHRRKVSWLGPGPVPWAQHSVTLVACHRAAWDISSTGGGSVTVNTCKQAVRAA